MSLEGFTVTSVDGKEHVTEQQEQPQVEAQEQVVEQPVEQPVEQVKEEPQEVEQTQEVNEPEAPFSVEKVTIEENDTIKPVQSEQSTSQSEAPVQDIPKQELPEGVESLLSFMQETGGTVEDYVRINQDYDNMDQGTLVENYLKIKYNGFSDDDVQLMMENLQYDEEKDDRQTILDKKLKINDLVNEAKSHFNNVKDKYYHELKSNSPTAQANQLLEQQKAAEAHSEAVSERFKQATNEFFDQGFEGFDFKVGKDAYKFKVNNPLTIKDNQSNIDNFLGRYFNESGEITDPAGYHRAIFAATNIDKIAEFFYEQGKSDGVTNELKTAKNTSFNDGRTVHQQQTEGTKWRLMDDGSEKVGFKFRKLETN